MKPIQDQMIEMIIEDFGSKSNLVNRLEIMAKRVHHDQIFYAHNMLIYFKSLFNQVVDVETDAITYHDASIATIKFLKTILKTPDGDTAQLLINLIEFKLETVDHVRRLAD